MPLDFKKLLSARFLYTFAVQMQAVVIGWRVYELMRDPLYLGMVGLTEAVPAIGLALYAGYIVDRSRPLVTYRNVIYISLVSGVLVLMEHVFQHQMDRGQQVLLLYAAAFLTGLARSFSQPSIYASVPRIVGRQRLMHATAMLSSAMQVARVAGPALGGLLFGVFGAIVSSSVVCGLLICAMVFVLLIEINIPAPEQTHKHRSIRDELLSGVRFVFSHPILFPAMSLDMVSVLFGGVTALLPIFAGDILQTGPKGLGALRAAPAVGAAIVAIFLSRKKPTGKSGPLLFACVAGFGVCILIFGASTSFALSLSVLALSGAFDSVSMVIRSSAVQLASPDHMRGKISSVNSIFIGSSNEIGEFESGIAARLMGTVPAVYFGGVMCLLTVAVTAYMAPGLRRLDLAKLENDSAN